MQSWPNMRKSRLEKVARKRREDFRNIRQDASKDLIIEEYKVVRDMIKTNIDIMEKTEIYAVGAIAAVAAYVFSAKDYWIAIGASALSIVLAAFGAYRYWVLAKVISVHGDYIEQIIEHRYINFLGWTAFYRENKPKSPSLHQVRFAFWAVLGLVGLGLLTFAVIKAPFAADELIIRRYQAEISN